MHVRVVYIPSNHHPYLRPSFIVALDDEVAPRTLPILASTPDIVMEAAMKIGYTIDNFILDFVTNYLISFAVCV